MTATATAVYTVQLGNTPDGDGDYRAVVSRDGAELQTIFRRDRDAALSEARAWAARHREYDPTDVETVEL